MPETEGTKVQLAVMNTHLKVITITLKEIKKDLGENDKKHEALKDDCTTRFQKIETKQAVLTVKSGLWSTLVAGITSIATFLVTRHF